MGISYTFPTRGTVTILLYQQKGIMMKMTHITAAALLLAGLSTAAFAEMGKCGGGMQQGMKCGGGMAMKGDFKTRKAMMLKHLDAMEKCVKSASNMQDLKACKMKMMENRKAMMQKKAPGNGAKAQCGTGKCGGGK